MASSKISPWERCFTLQQSLTGLVMSGARDIRWLNDRLQAIIDEPQTLPTDLDIPREESLEHTRYWEELFPRRGHAITEVLSPFGATNCFLPLSVEQPNLTERVRHALPWKPPENVSAMYPCNWLWEIYKCGFNEMFLRQFYYLLIGVLGNEAWDRLEKALWTRCGAALRDRLQTSVGEDGWARLFHGAQVNLQSVLWQSFWNSLLYAVAFAVVRDVLYWEPPNFQPLLSLWQSGNLPLCYAESLGRERLVVLCAER